jgi:hypothetical protein
MMKTAVVMMVLLGCDCDGVSCEYVRAVSSGWRSVETCRAAIDRQIAAEQASYPLVTAHCALEDPEAAPEPLAPPDEALVAAAATTANKAEPFVAARKQATALINGSLASVKATASWAGGGKAGKLVRRLPWLQGA